MTKALRVECLNAGRWTPLASVEDNYQRQVRLPVHKQVEGIRFILYETWGSEETSLYAFYVE